MNNRTVIIISSKNQVKWSIKYIKKNPNEDIILLATTIASQLELLKNGHDPFAYVKLSENLFPIDSLYNLPRKTKLTSNIINPNNITQKIINYLEKKNFYYKKLSIGKIFSYSLYSEIEKTCYFYYLCKKIDHKYKPTKILIEINNYTYLHPASKIFTNRLKEYRCQTVNLPKLSLLDYSYSILSMLCDKIISLNSFSNITGNKQIIFQSGGHILYYFHNCIKLFKNQNPQISYLLLTFKQTLKDNLILLKQGIYPLNQVYITSDKSSITEDKFKILKKILQRNITNDKLVSLLSLDIPLYELIKDKLISYIIKNLKQVIISIDKAFFIFAKTKPKLFITTHDLGISSMPYVLAAKNLRIQNMQIQHGLYMYADEADYYSDIAVVWGRETKILLEKRLNKKNIYVTGFMGFDNFKEPNHELNNKKVIFSILLTLYKLSDAHFSKFLHDLFPILAKYKQFEIRIRTHPGQDSSDYLNLAKFYKLKRIKINPQLSIQEFVRTSDIILSMDTTAILWAMYYHKPLFHTSPIWDETILPTKKYHAAWVPKNANDLINKLKEFMANPDIYKELLPGQKKFLEDYAGPLDGKSSERLVRLIEKLTKGKKLL